MLFPGFQVTVGTINHLYFGKRVILKLASTVQCLFCTDYVNASMKGMYASEVVND